MPRKLKPKLDDLVYFKVETWRIKGLFAAIDDRDFIEVVGRIIRVPTLLAPDKMYDITYNNGRSNAMRPADQITVMPRKAQRLWKLLYV